MYCGISNIVTYIKFQGGIDTMEKIMKLLEGLSDIRIFSILGEILITGVLGTLSAFILNTNKALQQNLVTRLVI